jgi:small-conductance mechanosensitive channel/CRP-like cAMP-binding protein
VPSLPQLIAEHPQIPLVAAAFLLAALSVLVIAVPRGAMWRLAGRIGLFVALTVALVSQGIVPYQPGPKAAVTAAGQIGVYFVEILWWVALTRCLVGVVDAFVILERRPQESRLFQQLIAGLIYLGVVLAIAGNVFNMPIGALFATSGAVAIIAGLALQSTLADVFSGIAISLGRSYRIGDSIIIDGGVEGKIVEANWQAVQLLTPDNDLAIIPNSVLAKAKIVNVSYPDETHDNMLLIRLQPTTAPSHFVEVALEALASCNLIMHEPAPSVTVKSLNASAIELELRYRVHKGSTSNKARNEVFDRIFRHFVAAGLRFAPVAGIADFLAEGAALAPPSSFETILRNVPLFATLGEEHKKLLAAKMGKKEYAAGDLVLERGALSQTLSIIQSGALAVYNLREGREHELLRLAPGDYFGEGGFLLGEPQSTAMRAITHAVVFEIHADDLCPILKERPSLSKELGEALARRRAMLAAKDAADSRHVDHSAKRFADRIRQLFQLDLSPPG